ncbi:hypothetical protein IHN63_00750 [Deinococcus sp. 6YEL10]|uniref:hypothetical protein n=1 Tax=Deinococcus sp. 6YEL10 TaxID=2745870 RepID=UPI001E2A81C7|nr:hypothetical protein [Deinococcus sp. 6YEL10]MCD0159826.1 hypothetical protein [Deinococcus sp. 6YEL10]
MTHPTAAEVQNMTAAQRRATAARYGVLTPSGQPSTSAARIMEAINSAPRQQQEQQQASRADEIDAAETAAPETAAPETAAPLTACVIADGARGIYTGVTVQETARAYGWTGTVSTPDAETYHDDTDAAAAYLDTLTPDGYTVETTESGDVVARETEATEDARDYFTRNPHTIHPDAVTLYRVTSTRTTDADGEKLTLHPVSFGAGFYAYPDGYNAASVDTFTPATIKDATHATVKGLAYGDHMGATVERSNYEHAAETYPTAHRIAYGYGGRDLMLTLSDAREVYEEMQEYPALNEDHLSALEYELQQEAVNDGGAADLGRAIVEKLNAAPEIDPADAEDADARLIMSEDNGAALFWKIHAGHDDFTHETAGTPYIEIDRMTARHTAAELLQLVRDTYPAPNPDTLPE